MRFVAIFAALCCLHCLVPLVASRYHEKTRFDRSVGSQSDKTESFGFFNKKARTYTDFETEYTAYKDASQSICYLEKFQKQFNPINSWSDIIRANKKTVYTSDRSLTKIETWRLAGGRVADFCQGMTVFLLQETKPDPIISEDPFLNELPEDENDIVQKRVADMVLAPLKVRAKRQALNEKRQKMNEEHLEIIKRRRRDAVPYRGKFRGQTQSQYLNVGTDGQKEGKAEAEATQQSSRAVVSGSSGMGQAQSMSSGTDGCEGCPGYDRIGSIPASITGTLGPQQGTTTGVEKSLDNVVENILSHKLIHA